MTTVPINDHTEWLEADRLEVWRDGEALELHKASPYLKASFKRRRDQGWRTEITRWMRVPEDSQH
jgi:quinol monooxygenase YgiN